MRGDNVRTVEKIRFLTFFCAISDNYACTYHIFPKRILYIFNFIVTI